MNADIEALVSKARRSLSAAERLFEDGHHDFAASRAYYAMFYLAEALLLARNLTFSSHSTVIAEFHREFVTSGGMSYERYAALQQAFRDRNIGDYHSQPFPADKARAVLESAKDFVADAEAWLRRQAG